MLEEGEGPIPGQKIFVLIEKELTRIRRMAEETADQSLLYFIDMAIIEANRESHSNKRGRIKD